MENIKDLLEGKVVELIEEDAKVTDSKGNESPAYIDYANTLIEVQKIEADLIKSEREAQLEERRIVLEEAKNRLEKRKQNIDCVKIGVGVAGAAAGTYISAKSIAFAAAKEEGGAIRTNALKGAIKWFESMASQWSKLLNSFR